MLRTAARQLLSAASAQHPQLDCTRAAAAAARCLHACCRSGSSAATCADGVEHSLHVSDLKLQHGGTFHTATVVYKTFGNPNNPAILFPTSFDATHSDGEYAIGPGRILDSSRYFVVVPNMLGNGLSTSPSTCGLRAAYPLVSIADNVALQRRLLRSLGVERVALAYGYSMGATQALTYAAMYPSEVERVVATCGTATLHSFNAVFLEGLLSILRSDPGYKAGSGFVTDPRASRDTLAAFGRVYAGWGLPAEWYRDELWRGLRDRGAPPGGYQSLESYLAGSWERWTVNADPNNLMAMLRTWRCADVAAAVEFAEQQQEGRRGRLMSSGAAEGAADAPAEAPAEERRERLHAALGRITARVVYMPSLGDRYFTAEDVLNEADAIADCTVVPVSLEWGHRAGDPYRPGQEGDAQLIRETVARVLSEPARE